MTNLVNLGEVSSEILDTKITLAFGETREDKNFRNMSGTIRDFLTGYGSFMIGPKDGKCVVQGELAGGRRLAKNMRANYILMLDIDTGMSTERLKDVLTKSGLFAFVWTTHSHMKDETDIPETKLVQFCSKKGIVLGFSEDEIVHAAMEYLRQEKLYDPAILSPTVTLVGRDIKDGGVVFTIKHAPMPKHRVLFVLTVPFDFLKGGTQVGRIGEWKQKYEALSCALNLPFDSSCVDPSRLMYLPRRAANSPAGEMFVVPGMKLDLDDMPVIPTTSTSQRAGSMPPAGDIGAAFVAAANGGSNGSTKGAALECLTPGLLRFVAAYPDFDAVSWLRSVAPDDERPGGPGGGRSGVHWTCPNEDNHTKVSADDTAFAVFGGEGESGWGMNCMHDGCTHASGRDRVWYLDRLCQAYGVAHANELRPFSEIAAREDRLDAVATRAAASPSSLENMVAEINAQSSEDEIHAVLVALAGVPPVAMARHSRTLAKALGLTPGKVERLAKDAAKEAAKRRAVEMANEAAEDGIALTAHPIPEDLSKAQYIWTDWPADVQVEATIARIHAANEKHTFLFRREEGGVFRTTESVSGRMTSVPVKADEWSAILNDHVTYKEVDTFGFGVEKVVSAPRFIPPILRGTDKWRFPELRTIMRVPLFDQDGVLQTKRGYNSNLKVFIDPVMEHLPVSAKPSAIEVMEARDLLFEAIRDFPFYDYGEGDKTIKTGEIGPDGFPVPNWDRGVSSRANMICMILQPFVRNLINGPTPAYHLDKPEPGTGAGFLADVAYIIAEGRRAEIQTMSSANEELRKNITATLRGGASIIFVDNINRKVDSGDLAAALTSGTWKDRILGQTETVTIPVTSMWIMAGNKLEFSRELVRRIVPVNIDAATPNPAQDRGPGSFKHDPLQDWLMDNRAKLVWACHTLIANWFAMGKPRGDVMINSFTHWSHVMGGILKAAGVEGFLRNVPAYCGKQNEAEDVRDVVARIIASQFGGSEWTAIEALEALRDPMSGQLKCEVPIQKPDDARAFGRWLGVALEGSTVHLSLDAPYPKGHGFMPYRLPDESRVYKVQITSRKLDGKKTYKFRSINT